MGKNEKRFLRDSGLRVPLAERNLGECYNAYLRAFLFPLGKLTDEQIREAWTTDLGEPSEGTILTILRDRGTDTIAVIVASTVDSSD